MATTIVDWLNDGTLPQSKASGAWTPSAFNTGKFRQVWTPTNASTHASWRPGGLTYWAILSTNDAVGGGVWLEWNPGTSTHTLLIADATTGNPITGSMMGITWGAGQAITYTVDQSSATANASKLTVAGATTGNGISTGYTRTSILSGTTLYLGTWGGGAGYALLPSTFGDIDDGVDVTILPASGTSATASSTTATLTPGTVLYSASGSNAQASSPSAIFSDPSALIASGSSASTSSASATFTPGVVALSAAGASATASTSAATAANATIALGVFATDFQIYGTANRPATITLTFTAGSMILVASGGKSSDISAGPTSSRGETFRRLDTIHDYPDFPGYGTGLWCCYSAVGGSTTITIPVTAFDENTTFVWEIKAGKNVRSLAWSQHGNAGAGTTQTSGTIVSTGLCVLSYLWWGSSPVVSGGPDFTATPSRGTVIGSYLVNNNNGEVQAALAVEQGAVAGSYSVTWTHSPAQGAQLWILAAQEGEPSPGAVATASAGNATLTSVVSMTAAGAVATASSSAAAMTSTIALVATGTEAQAASSNATLSPGDVSTPGTGSTVAVLTGSATFVPGSVTLTAAGSGASVSSSPATATPSAVSITASGAEALVATGAASLNVSTAPGEMSAVGAISAASTGAAVLIPGAVSIGATGSVALAHSAAAVLGNESHRPPIPPGRAETRLVGRVVVPSIESREVQLTHLFGVVRNEDV